MTQPEGTQPEGTQPEGPYQEFRSLMFSIAYRMTGSVSDAEDIVQEAFLGLARGLSAGTVVESPKAYLATATTRHAINHLRSARVRREAYVGTWLPEPLVAEEGRPPQPAAAPDPAERAELADSLSMAFLVMLESLAPVERAVFLLREVFGYDYAEVARIVGKSEQNCRQIFARARQHIGDRRPRFESSRAKGEELARRFFAAAAGGEMDTLLELLAAAGVGERPARRARARPRRPGDQRVHAGHRRRGRAGDPFGRQPGQARPSRAGLGSGAAPCPRLAGRRRRGHGPVRDKKSRILEKAPPVVYIGSRAG